MTGLCLTYAEPDVTEIGLVVGQQQLWEAGGVFSERILVAIGPTPLAERLVRAGKRLASGLKASLAQSGYAVTHLKTGGEAIAACGTAACDLVVLDLGLPDIDGIEALRKMREKGLRAPVLILTARDSDFDVVSGLRLGADDYLTKPFNPRELTARIQAGLRRVERYDDRLRCVERSVGLLVELPEHHAVGHADHRPLTHGEPPTGISRGIRGDGG